MVRVEVTPGTWGNLWNPWVPFPQLGRRSGRARVQGSSKNITSCDVLVTPGARVQAHLDESQRAMCAGRLADMRQGERMDLELSANLPKVSQQDAAELLNVGDRNVRNAVKVQQGDVNSNIRKQF